MKALFEKAVLFTWKGEVLTGNPMTLDANPACSETATKGARYKLSVDEDNKTNFEPSFVQWYWSMP